MTITIETTTINFKFIAFVKLIMLMLIIIIIITTIMI